MSEEFSSSVQFGLRLSQRIYYGKHSSPPPPMEIPSPAAAAEKYVPAGPAAYAVVFEPETVDNPDVPSYQPYVYGRSATPALIPLHMLGVGMAAECCFDTVFVTLSATWRLHCLARNRACECRVAVPIGEQGSVLGLEVEGGGRSCQTELITIEDFKDSEKIAKAKDGFLLKRRIFTVKVLQVEGGSNLFMRVSWSQKLEYQDGQWRLNIPFTFPSYINPVGRKIKKKEKIHLSINHGTGAEVLCRTCSHPLKEVKRHVGKLEFFYESEVSAWSSTDLLFTYEVSLGKLLGGLILQPPSLQDIDQREMFCLYLFPDNQKKRKFFRREVVFLVDISGSMREGPLESCKTALLAALSKLDPGDSFNVIAFNTDIQLFSPSMELATSRAINSATRWISENLIAEGGTNLLLPLTQALEMLAKPSNSVPLVFLITDGAVEDERHICSVVKNQLANRRAISPRVYTFGIGPYSNHYFLQMLAEVGRGYYEAAYEIDVISFRLQRLFDTALQIEIANITVDGFEGLDSVEFYPNSIPDLSSSSPLIVFGRCRGNFPDSCNASGVLPDMSSFSVDLKVNKSTDLPLSRVSARREIDFLTAHAWYSQSKQLEDKVARLSMQTGVPSEYTQMILVKVDKRENNSKPTTMKENIIFLRNMGNGFGNTVATLENLQPYTESVRLHETAELIPKAASRCCSKMIDLCCCMCFIRFCSSVNDKCAVTLAQICTALGCFECINCCFEVCACDW